MIGKPPTCLNLECLCPVTCSCHMQLSSRFRIGQWHWSLDRSRIRRISCTARHTGTTPLIHRLITNNQTHSLSTTESTCVVSRCVWGQCAANTLPLPAALCSWRIGQFEPSFLCPLLCPLVCSELFRHAIGIIVGLCWQSRC